MTRRLLVLFVLASALVLAAGAEAGSRAFKPRTTAQTMMSHFILNGKVPRRWFCRYGHSRDALAATCARTVKTAPIVRDLTG